MENLNSEQRAAVGTLDKGHVAVVAGPGTGKTHTLISAVLDRLEDGVPAEAILALTFTNKAAGELTARLKKGRAGKVPQATTFHAWAYSQIKDKLDDRKLADNFALTQALHELKKQTSSKHTVRELGLIISRCKNGSDNSAASKALLKAYDELLARDNLIDFDDLLRLYLDGTTKPTYQYIFVDEFQDSSPLQYQLLKRFVDSGARLFAIGDPNQSIYGFRGAGGEVFDKLLNDYRPEVVRLTQNYRSATAIVEAAAGLFPGSAQQPVNEQPGFVRIVETLDIHTEADYLIRTIEHALGGTDWSAVHHDEHNLGAEHFRDFAVLYRHNRQGRLLAERLRSAGLPVQVTGEESPYATPLALAVLGALLYISEPEDEFKQRAVTAARLIGNKTSLPWLDEVDIAQPPAKLAEAVLKHLGKADEMQPVLNGLSMQPDLPAAVAWWQGLAEQEFYDPTADCITLSTIHASKGLEFRNVFVAGCNKDILPSRKGDIDEEKRLFYVALTRAIESATLLSCRSIGGKPAEPSRFLVELPDTVQRQTDDHLEQIQKRRTKARLKRSQQSLF